MNTILDIPELRVQTNLGRLGDAVVETDPIMPLF